MKKLSIIYLVALILGIMSSSAFALSFKFDFYGGDTSYTQGDFEDPQEIYLSESETVMVDIWLLDWPDARPNIQAVQYHFTWHKDSLDVVSIACNNPDWHICLDSLVVDGDYLLGLTILFGGGVVGPDVLLHTFELRCEAVPSDDWIKATLGSDGYVADMDYVQYFDVADGDGIIHQIADIPTMLPVETECPVFETECPIIDTRCPESFTLCPTYETWCPVNPTVCPVDMPTVCPEVFTVCPLIDTWCPDDQYTVCLITQCPYEPTECFPYETYCPWEYTYCPQEFTICPEVHTVCPDSTPTVCKLTLCPQEQTLCPEDQTFCPLGPTLCPQYDTICGPITECPNGQHTLCPDIPTMCPTRWTFCPEVPTQCPVVETFCPDDPTFCMSPPTSCPTGDPTWCPEVLTQCPQLDTWCPDNLPTLCEATNCPVSDTLCPINPTVCPQNFPTICPLAETQCPEVVTQCPTNPTFCPIVDSDGDGVDDCSDNCPNHPNGPSLGTCTKIQAGLYVSYREGDPKHYVTCNSDSDCQTTGGCQKAQEDSDFDGCGDVCECYANFNYPTDLKVNASDLGVFKLEYGRIDCHTVPPPCRADGNDDGKVNAQDLGLFKNEYGRIDCPACP